VSTRPEVWLRGPIEGVPALLQPVAHALLQAVEEVETALRGFPEELLWTRPTGVASVGFHLQHVVGVVDRLFTYARGEALLPEQLASLSGEGVPPGPGERVDPVELARTFRARVEAAVAELRGIPESTLLERRGVGRRQLPSTRIGLLFHAAEHVQRHVGQLIVTIRVQTGSKGEPIDQAR
jgi:uncharacterized damage-inducible protein DinB